MLLGLTVLHCELPFSDTEMQGTGVQRLVTADGTYATQSAFSTQVVKKKEEK